MNLDQSQLDAYSRRAKLIGRSIEHLPEATSTNDLCHERADDRDAEGLVIVADHQTAGRGQRGRSWSAPPRSALLFSCLLKPAGRLAEPTFLVAWTAVGLAKVFRSLGVDACIKWPNDILAGGRKIAGILVERRAATVIGVGVNVNIPPEAFPHDLRLPASSLAIELGRPIDRTRVFLDILAELDALHQSALTVGPESVWSQWTELAESLVGLDVLVTTTSSAVSGRLADWRPDRGVQVLLPSGEPVSLPAEHIQRVERLCP